MTADRYLEIRNIRKSYGPTLALSDINLSIEKGEFLALLGPSGCGKSTLLRIMAGLLPANDGQMLLDGEDITSLPAWKRDIGLVFQNYALFPHMSVRENVQFGLDMRQLSAAEKSKMVDEALDVVSMGDYASRKPAQLSGGQQQRVAIARAIAIKPRLLLLDEPLSNLDAVLRQNVRLELRELHQRTGLTTIMVTHDQVEALTLADKIAVLDKGVVLQNATASDLYERPETSFVASFVGSPSASLLPVQQSAPSEFKLGFGVRWHPPIKVAKAMSSLKRTDILLALRPEQLQIVAADHANAMIGRVKTIEYLGSDRLAHIAVGDDQIQVRLGRNDTIESSDVGVLMPDELPVIFAPDTGERIGPREPEVSI